MKLTGSLLLLSVFVVAACNSGTQVTEVSLESSEQGTLKLYTLNQSEMTLSGMDENPGYMDNGAFSDLFSIIRSQVFHGVLGSVPVPEPESAYAAFYEKEGSLGPVTVFTAVFNPEDMDAALEAFHLMSIRVYAFRVLHKENTIVLVASSDDSELTSDIADKLSQRFGMEFLNDSELASDIAAKLSLRLGVEVPNSYPSQDVVLNR